MTTELTPTEDALMHGTFLFVMSRCRNFGIHLHENELSEAFLNALADWIADARMDDVFDPPRARWFHRFIREAQQ